MKRLKSIKLVDVVGEKASISPRRDPDNLSAEEHVKISTRQTSAGTSTELAGTSKSTEQDCASTSKEEACASTSKEEACASTSKEEACASTSKEEACASISKEEASASTSKGEASASTSKGEASASTSKEEASVCTSKEEACASTSKDEACASTSKVQPINFSEQPAVLQLKRLFSDFPRISLPAYVDFGKLVSIAQKYVEVRSTIGTILLLNRALPFLNREEQKNVVATIMKMKEYIKELSQLTDTPYDPEEVDLLFCRLGCRLDYICSLLQKTRVLRYSQFLVFGSDVYPLENRRNVVLRENDEDVDESFLRRICKSQTYMRTHLDMKYLGEISRDHPEFDPCIKTALDAYAAMKYLTYEGQVKVFKSLYMIQETIKELVLYKTYRAVYSFEKFVPILIIRVSMCLSELLENLRKEIMPQKKMVMPSCEPCQTVRKYVKNVNVKQELLEKTPFNRQLMGLGSVVPYAKVGIRQGRFRSLESLFHHLTAIKEAAYRHTFLYQSRIDWFEIARQYKEYRTKAHQDLVQLGVWKDQIFWRLVELDEVMAEARTFCDVIRGICFTANETLSDSIALSGELEMLAPEAEDNLTSLGELIGHFLQDWSNYLKVNLRVRRSRIAFLTKDQWDAFDFPY